MRDRRIPCELDGSRLFSLVTELVDVRRHIDLMNWLQGDVQQYLPHDILVAAWGDFHLGLVHYDVLSVLPGVRSENSAVESITPLLATWFNSWISMNRKPLVVHCGQDGFLWEGALVDLAMTAAMQGMRSALVHGISDQRGRHDCLYVWFSTQAQHHGNEAIALKYLLPYVDCALRQVDLLPHQYQAGRLTGALPSVTAIDPTNADVGAALDALEVDIMKLASLGKTNKEISSILDVSSFTVKNHMQRIFRKLDVFSRAQAVSVFANSINSHAVTPANAA
jgi:transcriptional regulator EpsA